MDQSEPNVSVSIVDLSSLTPDPRNANKGTERGRYMVARSHEKFGAARSGVIDRNGVIIAGNKSAEAQAELGMDRVIVVETDGSMPVYVRRNDLDIDDPKARELAYADNRTSEIDLQWDAERIARDQLDGVDISDFFHQDEIDRLMDAVSQVDAPSLPDGDRSPFQSMTFTLHDAQVEVVREALRRARLEVSDGDVSENSNGNALAAICHRYVNG